MSGVIFCSPDHLSYLLDIDYRESYEIPANSFSSKHLSLDNHDYPNFGNQTSDSYFEQDFKMYHDEDELFGGMRGICWRSRYKLDLHDVGSMASMDDAKFMFNITNLLMKSTTS